MEVDQNQREENKAAGENNVLFEPAIYAQNAEFEDAMDSDVRRNKTNPGGAGGKIDSEAIDKSILH